MLPQWHIKDPGHSAKSVGHRWTCIHPWPSEVRVSRLTILFRHIVGAYQGGKLTYNPSGNTWPQLSELDELIWIESGLKSGTGVYELISTLKKKKKEVHAEKELSNLPNKSSQVRKKPPPPPACLTFQWMPLITTIRTYSITYEYEDCQWRSFKDWLFVVIVSYYVVTGFLFLSFCPVADKLIATFQKLDFDVISYENCTDTDMVQIMQRMVFEDHTNYDCFVCCILTHGVQGSLYGTNGLTVPIRDMTGPLRAQSCPSLAGKPKLFFMQACQGREKQEGQLTFCTLLGGGECGHGFVIWECWSF